jgi:hypothetical protein
MPWGELTMKNEACGRKNWMMAAWGGGGGPVRGGATRRDMRGGGSSPQPSRCTLSFPFACRLGH